MLWPPLSHRACCLPLVILLTLFTSTSNRLMAEELLKADQRVVFLGDSNTYAGTYVSEFDALTRNNGLPLDVINLGLPSETCCGLSEPGHPFPRPNVHERLDRVLAKTEPAVVIACYGMNDAIYHPFSQERFEKYQTGIRELIRKVKKSGAKLVLLTPPPFDPLPLKKQGKLVDAEAKQFAWSKVYAEYDSVLEKYSNWILTLDDDVDAVIDIRSPIVEFLAQRRETDPDFTMSGDGVHFNAACHRIIAQTLVEQVRDNPDLEIQPAVGSLMQQKMQILRDAWLSETGHQRPGIKAGLPLDEATKRVQELDADIEKQLKR